MAQIYKEKVLLVQHGAKVNQQNWLLMGSCLH